ncbi:MAG: aspartate aminotransferase [Rhodobacteraceae bacterium CG17_big_fil_post_rev_8_21_14_2_50_65_11]|nr:MAG: aspartate aminotransferase [Rhodobacteraceae bacterium CG17_big_fil_post_rev_8_21_14_2_50_65_11]
MRQSRRISTLNGDGDDGWGLFLAARRMIGDGIAVVELTIGEHDIGTDARILDAMHASAMAGNTGYAMVPGIDALRDHVAARVQARSGVATTRDNVMITPGGQAALFMAHHATCDEGDRALYIDPYYATYPGTIRSVGAVPVAVQAESATGFQPDPDNIAAAAPGARSLLINSPNNPTGAVYTAETMEGIARVVEDHDLWLISDEVYDTQVWQGRHVSPRSLPGMAERTLQVGSLSKSHAMTGSRCGWIVAPEDVTGHLIQLATNTNYGVAGFVQSAGLFALELGAAFEAEIAAPFRRRRDIVLDLVARQQAVRAIPAQGAMYAMLDIRATGMSGEAFGMALLKDHHIAVMPGESFGDAAAGHVRLALTVDDERLREAVAVLLDFAGKIAEAQA